MRHISSVLSILTVFFLISSCSTGTGYKLRTFQAIPSLEIFNLTVDDIEHASSLSYSETTEYKSVNQEILNYRGLNDQGERIFGIAHTLSKKGKYTFFIAGAVNDPDFIIVEDDTIDLESLQTAIRFWNGAEDGMNYDIYVTEPGVSLSEVNSRISNFDYATTSPYQAYSAGTYQIRMTEQNNSSNVVVNETIEFSLGQVYTLALIEADNGGAPLQLILLQDN